MRTSVWKTFQKQKFFFNCLIIFKSWFSLNVHSAFSAFLWEQKAPIQPVFCSPASPFLYPSTWDLFGCVVFIWVHSGLFIRGYIPAKFNLTLYCCSGSYHSLDLPTSLFLKSLYITGCLLLGCVHSELTTTPELKTPLFTGVGLSNKSQLYRAFISGLWLCWSLDPRLICLRESVTFLKLFCPKAPFSQRLFYTVWHFRSVWNAPHVRWECKSLSMCTSPL